MDAHSPQHLSEWAELTGAALPDEYEKRDYKLDCDYDCDREFQKR